MEGATIIRRRYRVNCLASFIAACSSVCLKTQHASVACRTDLIGTDADYIAKLCATCGSKASALRQPIHILSDAIVTYQLQKYSVVDT